MHYVVGSFGKKFLLFATIIKVLEQSNGITITVVGFPNVTDVVPMTELQVCCYLGVRRLMKMADNDDMVGHT